MFGDCLEDVFEARVAEGEDHVPVVRVCSWKQGHKAVTRLNIKPLRPLEPTLVDSHGHNFFLRIAGHMSLLGHQRLNHIISGLRVCLITSDLQFILLAAAARAPFSLLLCVFIFLLFVFFRLFIFFLRVL